MVAYIRPEGYLVTRFIVGGPDHRRGRPPAGDDPPRRRLDPPRSTTARPSPASSCRYRIGEAYRALAEARGVPDPAPPTRRARGGVRRIEIAPAGRSDRACGRATTTCSTPTSSTTATRIRIVDWEYAGMGDPFFDLGNFSVNHGLDAGRGRGPAGGLRRVRCAPTASARLTPHARRVRLPRGACGASSSRPSARSTWTSSPTPTITSSGCWQRRSRPSRGDAGRRATLTGSACASLDLRAWPPSAAPHRAADGFASAAGLDGAPVTIPRARAATRNARGGPRAPP